MDDNGQMEMERSEGRRGWVIDYYKMRAGEGGLLIIIK